MFVSLIFRLTDEESRKNWQEYGNPDGPEGELWFVLLSYVREHVCVCAFLQALKKSL